MKRIIHCICAIALCLGLLPQLSVAHAVGSNEAERLEISISGSGYKSFSFLSDGNVKSYKNASASDLILESQDGMASLYLMFDKECGEYSITDNVTGASITAGQYGFLHEYVDLKNGFGALPTSLTIRFENRIELSEIYAFSEGDLPDYVQIWQPPLDDKADILLLATHGDDDQLYFAGLFPYYAAERGYAVQVAYLTDHRNITDVRTHEMLNGLWATGVTAYPVFGDFDDFRIDSLQGTYNEYRSRGTSRDDLLRYVVTILRRFNPQVVVGHDFNGEYGHGMHRVYTDLLVEALDHTGNEEIFPDIAQEYGVWEVPKTYIHLYETNPIVIDYDQPLKAFDGLTAFQVTQQYGFPCHESQQGYMFTPWLYGKRNEITKVTQITKYNPAQFGLYRSTVGEDVEKNDFMENIVSYAEQARLEAERLEAERLEAERLAREEQERLEAERLEQERIAQEQREAEELRKAQEAAQQAREHKKSMIIKSVVLAASAVVFIAVIVVLILCFAKKRRSGRFSRD